MALATTITGSGTLVSVDNNIRVWRFFGMEIIYVNKESTKEEVYEWVALTEACAKAAADAASQEGLGDGVVASYSASEDNRAIGSYKLTKRITYAMVFTQTTENYPT
jgi:hypothetical protein